MTWKTAGSMPSLTTLTMLLRLALLVRKSYPLCYRAFCIQKAPEIEPLSFQKCNYRSVQVSRAVVVQVKEAAVIKVNEAVFSHVNEQGMTEKNRAEVLQIIRASAVIMRVYIPAREPVLAQYSFYHLLCSYLNSQIQYLPGVK